MMKIDTVDVYLAKQLDRGEITLEEAAKEFYRCGWTNFVDVDATRRFLNRIKAK